MPGQIPAWLRRHVRLLPALIGLSALLLAMKVDGIAVEAYAQVGAPSAPSASSDLTPAPAVPKKNQDAATKPDAAPISENADAGNDSAAEVDVLTSLSKRRDELDKRAAELDMRQNLIAAAEQRIDSKIDTLKQLQARIQQLLSQRDAAQEKQVASLVKTYAAMKPRDAARIFDGLNGDVLIAVASAMKPDALAPILSSMQPENARKLTMRLAGRFDGPQPSAAASPAPATGQAQTPTAQTSAPAKMSGG